MPALGFELTTTRKSFECLNQKPSVFLELGLPQDPKGEGRRFLNTLQAKNTPNNRCFKLKNAPQPTSEQLQKNFQKVKKLVF